MDQPEFDDFYATSFPRLVMQLHAMIGDREEAQDCVQDAFVRAWSHRRALDRSGRPEAWVRTTAYRLAVSRWRRRQTERKHVARAQEPDTQIAGPDEARMVLIAALQRLPIDQRRALVLHHLCDLSVEDVAREVDSPTGTVKAWLSRGRAALAAELTDKNAGDHIVPLGRREGVDDHV